MKRGTHDAARTVARLTASGWAAQMARGFANRFDELGDHEWAATAREYFTSVQSAATELDGALRAEVIEP